MNIYYVGGYAGNFLLYLILLGKKHICCFNEFENNEDFSNNLKKALAYQWQLRETWKDTELTVNNECTRNLKTTDYEKIYFNCIFNDNVLLEKAKTNIASSKSVNISISTEDDISELLFRHKFPQYRYVEYNRDELIEEKWSQFYNGIKYSDDWPSVDFLHADDLSREIKGQICKKFFNSDSLNLRELFTIRFEKDLIEGKKMFEKFCIDDIEKRQHLSRKLKEYTDIDFDLTTIIKTKGKNVCDNLDLTYTTDIENFVDLWVNLHPQHIIDKLLKVS